MPSSEASLQRLLQDLRARAEAAESRAQHAEAHSAQLAQKVQAQDQLIASLMEQVTSLTRRLALATDRPEQLALELELQKVQRRLNDLNRERFGATSERRGRRKRRKAAKKERTGHGPTPQPDLPRQEQLHLLDEADQVCPRCLPPRPLEPWQGQTQDAEEVTVVERTFKICVHKRQVYRCPDCDHIEVALGPDRMLPGGRYSLEFAASVAVDKFADAQPLARQARRMGEQGLVVTRQTLWDQLQALYVLLLPALLRLHATLLTCAVLHADETSWRLMRTGASKRWWAWVLTDDTLVYFLFASTRSQAAARQLLGDYDGILMADRYGVYESLEKARTRHGGPQQLLALPDTPSQPLPTPDYTLAACWMHGRRGFIQAARHGEEAAEEVLDLIGELYAIEARAKERVADIADRHEHQIALLEARRVLRTTEARAILQRLRLWLDTVVTVPDLPLEDAVKWLDNGWTSLTRFVDDPRIPLDNGAAERAIRNVVLGRKTFAGSRSPKGAEVAALFYSLIESCRRVGVPARAYLIEAARQGLRDRSRGLLPTEYAEMLAVESAENREVS